MTEQIIKPYLLGCDCIVCKVKRLQEEVKLIRLIIGDAQ